MVRIQADVDTAPAGLDEMAAGGELDLVQLDYVRPRTAAVSGPGPVELPEFAGGFVHALRALRKTLYLEPQLCVASSAGWSTSYECVENAARVLVEGGCGELPISAVRGSNLLPILDDLAAAGVVLDNVETGAPWSELPGVAVAADLQLGAGPLATALAEGARVIVAGCYDGASAATAAAMRAHGWAWSDWHSLAGAATAARAALWSPYRGSQWFTAAVGGERRQRVELHASGDSTVELTCRCDLGDCQELTKWLQNGGARLPQADVTSNSTQLTVSTTGPHQVGVSGARGSKPDGRWRLEVLYQSGFVAEVLLEFLAGADGDIRRQLRKAIDAHFADAAGGLRVRVAPLMASKGEGASWLHVVGRSPTPKVCQHFADQMSSFVAANAALVRSASGRPVVLALCEVWPAAVPRDAVDIAVDTRSAKEWE